MQTCHVYEYDKKKVHVLQNAFHSVYVFWPPVTPNTVS